MGVCKSSATDRGAESRIARLAKRLHDKPSSKESGNKLKRRTL